MRAVSVEEAVAMIPAGASIMEMEALDDEIKRMRAQRLRLDRHQRSTR